jgi:hypothetical protein
MLPGSKAPVQATRLARPLYTRPERRTENWVQVTLLIVISSLLFYLMAVPHPPISRESLQAEREIAELRLTLREMRALIENFRMEHGDWPGRGGDGPDPSGFEQGVSYGAAESEARARTKLRIMAGIPKNPVNGLRTVRYLTKGDDWPAEPDGSTGWYYRPSTGEIRANCPGRAFRSNVRYFDL